MDAPIQAAMKLMETLDLLPVMVHNERIYQNMDRMIRMIYNPVLMDEVWLKSCLIKNHHVPVPRPPVPCL